MTQTQVAPAAEAKTASPYLALERMALKVREHIIHMSGEGGCFIGASLSCADLLVHLYERVLKVDADSFDDPNRDYLLLSKGHDVPALYGVFVEKGWMPVEQVRNHLKPGSNVYWHPNTKNPGVEFHSGSLGHLLSVGLGIALDKKLKGHAGRVFVVLGDGELNEGSVWEALLVAKSRGADNLVPVVDRNWFQANMRTEDLQPLEPLAPKFEAFGWDVTRFDGHDFAALAAAFDQPIGTDGKHRAFIADTQRGKGLPSIAEQANRWFVNFTKDEITQLLEELHGGVAAEIVSEPLHVR